jgi:hypothetical protein
VTLRSLIPDLDRLCILDAFVEGESLAAGAVFFSLPEAIGGTGGPSAECTMVPFGAQEQWLMADINVDKDRTSTWNRAVVDYY